MISFDDMPDDNEELAKVQIEFPLLSPNSAESCPVSIREVVAYLRMELPDGDPIKAKDLQFLRTALVVDHRYWIWRCRDSDGDDCFVTVAAYPEGGTCVGYDTNEYGLTAEQYLLGDFHEVF